MPVWLGPRKLDKAWTNPASRDVGNSHIEGGGGRDLDGLVSGDGHGLAGAGVAAIASGTLDGLGGEQTGKLHLLALGQGAGDDVGESLDGLVGLGLGERGLLGDSLDELGLGHGVS